MKRESLLIISALFIIFIAQSVIASDDSKEFVTVEGKIILDDTEPVEGFVTAVYTGSQLLLNNCRTDEEGNYSFKTKRGFDTLVAKASGFISEEISVDPSEQNGDSIHHDFFLIPAVELSGVVFNDKGFPVPGAEVRILYRDDLQRALTFEQEKGGVIANEQGRFRLPFVAANKPFVIYGFTENTLPLFNEELVTDADNQFDVNVMIGPERGSVQGEIVDADGNPLSGVAIMLRASADGEIYTTEERSSEVLFNKLYQQQISNDSGEFSFPGVPLGKVELLVRTAENKQLRKEISHFSEKSSPNITIILE